MCGFSRSSMNLLLNIDGLRRKLEKLKIDPRAYSIGSPGDEMLCLEVSDEGQWSTYYGERGNKFELKFWESESDACIYMLGRIVLLEL